MENADPTIGKSHSMAWSQFLTAFAAIFVAELGDKTHFSINLTPVQTGVYTALV